MEQAESPRWDLTVVFPSLASEEFDRAFEKAAQEIQALEGLFDRLDIRKSSVPADRETTVARFEEATNRLNAILETTRTIGSYLGCLVTTDAADESAQSAKSRFEAKRIPLDLLRNRYVAWIGTLDLDALLEGSELARSHAFPLAKAKRQAQFQMSEAEESLATELSASGLSGWARLHGQLSALLTATVDAGDGPKSLPMSAIRGLANHPDRNVRRAAFDAEIAAWETVVHPMAAALNGIKGFQRTVRARRGYEDDLEPSLLANNIARETLSAMQSACIKAFPDFRRYLAAKARALGLERLAWFDLSAPVGRSAKTWTWPEAEAFVVENFGSYSSRLADFASRAFQERWTDAEPRAGKEGGAYCSGIRPGESRIMMNFDGSFTSVSTLAHELGHAYHNLNLAERAPLQRAIPSALAETASIFCETIAFDAALKRADRGERLALLDTLLQRDLVVVVDIHSRFLFEKAVFEKRAERDLTISEFKRWMTESQLQTYGDAADPLHPYMWAVKGHYYGPTFYNYPYAFGLLFGLGLFARYREEPGKFVGEYDAFLSSAGLEDARRLGERFELDIATEEFWETGMNSIRRDIEEFVALVDEVGSADAPTA